MNVPNKSTAIFATVIAASMPFVSPANSGPLPLACKAKPKIFANNGLCHHASGCMEYPASFYYNDYDYKVLALSIAQKRPKTFYYCYRYELENDSGKIIERLYWKTAGVAVKYFRPGVENRLYNMVPKPDGTPRQSRNGIDAFINTHFDVVAYVHPSEIALKDIKKTKFVELQTRLGFNGREIKIVSYISVDEDKVTYYFQINSDKGKLNTMRYYAPYVYGVLYLKKNLTPDPKLFVYAMSAKPKPIAYRRAPNLTYKVEVSFPRKSAFGLKTYVAQQPITIGIGKEAGCMLAPVYTPVPVSVGFSGCKEGLQRK